MIFGDMSKNVAKLSHVTCSPPPLYLTLLNLNNSFLYGEELDIFVVIGAGLIVFGVMYNLLNKNLD